MLSWCVSACPSTSDSTQPHFATTVSFSSSSYTPTPPATWQLVPTYPPRFHVTFPDVMPQGIVCPDTHCPNFIYPTSQLDYWLHGKELILGRNNREWSSSAQVYTEWIKVLEFGISTWRSRVDLSEKGGSLSFFWDACYLFLSPLPRGFLIWGFRRHQNLLRSRMAKK